MSVFAAVLLRAAEQAPAQDAVPAMIDADPSRQAEKLRIRWQKKPEAHDFETAEEYLSLVLGEEHVLEAMRQLRDARHPQNYTAKEIFNAAQLTPLTAADTGVAKKLARLAKGKRLPPIMIVRREGAPLILAAGYHRACTGYVLGKQTPVAAFEARIGEGEV